MNLANTKQSDWIIAAKERQDNLEERRVQFIKKVRELRKKRL